MNTNPPGGRAWFRAVLRAATVLCGLTLVVPLPQAPASATTVPDRAGAAPPEGADVNLLEDKKATGTGRLCGESHGPEKAVDGGVSIWGDEKWCSDRQDTDQYLQVDLGKSTDIGGFLVFHDGAIGTDTRFNTKAFTIGVSADGSAFRDVVTVTGNTAGVTRHVIAPVKARYVRLTITAATSSAPDYKDRAQILEFEAYSTAPPTIDETDPGCHADAPRERRVYLREYSHTGRTLYRIGCDKDAAVYLDGISRAQGERVAAWILPYARDVWRYVKDAYGSCAVPVTLPPEIGSCERMGEPKPLLLYALSDEPMFGMPQYRWHVAYGGRPSIIWLFRPEGFKEIHLLRDMITHEACHHAEGGGQGILDSPTFGDDVWGDGPWPEFCGFDFYVQSGRSADALRFYNDAVNRKAMVPLGTSGTMWFQDWFYPLWRDGGGNAEVMQHYFELLARYWPTDQNPMYGHAGARQYRPTMNVGEFVHFMSGALGKDLSGRAKKAFNSAWDEAQFAKAKADYPKIKYDRSACASCNPIRFQHPGFAHDGRPGKALSIPVPATSTTEREAITYSATGLPAGVRIDSATGRISGTPQRSGASLVKVRAAGDAGHSATATLLLNITDFTGPITAVTGGCLDNQSSLTTDGNTLQVWPCHEAVSQTWSGQGGQLMVQGGCMTISNNGTANGTPVVLWECDGRAAQQWRFSASDRSIRNPGTGKCLTSTGELKPLTISACSGDWWQQFTLPA